MLISQNWNTNAITLIMEYLKEDGSLDVERIRNLPREEFYRVIARFTREQVEDFFSKVPVSHGLIIPVKVNYKMEDLLARGWTTAEQLSNMIREKCKCKI